MNYSNHLTWIEISWFQKNVMLQMAYLIFYHMPVIALYNYNVMSAYDKKNLFSFLWIAPEILSYDPISTATDMW